MKNAKTVEGYIESKGEWAESLQLLRKMFRATKLKEELKWGMPTYTHNKKNIAGFSAFKSYVGIWFFQGVFLKDRARVLINAQEGVTKAQRQWRFSNAGEIRQYRLLIQEYLEEAIRNQEAGLEHKAERTKTVVIPGELKKALKENPSLKDSFDGLTKGRQREYAEYIREAKRDETRARRLEKIMPMILEGLGLNDRYSNS